MSPSKKPEKKEAKPRTATTEKDAELSEGDLGQVAGGLARTGGDDDLDDLEVERRR